MATARQASDTQLEEAARMDPAAAAKALGEMVPGCARELLRLRRENRGMRKYMQDHQVWEDYRHARDERAKGSAKAASPGEGKDGKAAKGKAGKAAKGKAGKAAKGKAGKAEKQRAASTS